MPDFNHKKIKSGAEHIAEILYTTRKNRDLKLSTVAKQTGIRLVYLEALEKGELHKLPAGVYGKNYLREYALLLQLDPKPLLASFNQEIDSTIDKKGKVFIERARHTQFFIAIPKLIKILAIIFTVSLCALYLVFYLRNLTEAPYLELTQPATDITTSSSSINILGKSEAEAEISINGKTVLGNENGEFKIEIFLKKGLNTISVQSKKKYSQIAIINRKILVE